MDNRPNSKAKQVVSAVVSLHMLTGYACTATEVARYAGVSYNTAKKWLDRLEQQGDVYQTTVDADRGVVKYITEYGFGSDQHAKNTARKWGASYEYNLELPF